MTSFKQFVVLFVIFALTAEGNCALILCGNRFNWHELLAARFIIAFNLPAPSSLVQLDYLSSITW